MSGLQYVDGTIETTARESPAVRVNFTQDWGVSGSEARQLAALLIEAADEADRLAGNQSPPGTV